MIMEAAGAWLGHYTAKTRQRLSSGDWEAMMQRTLGKAGSDKQPASASSRGVLLS